MIHYLREIYNSIKLNIYKEIFTEISIIRKKYLVIGSTFRHHSNAFGHNCPCLSCSCLLEKYLEQKKKWKSVFCDSYEFSDA